MNRREAFNKHYQHNLFKGKESASGPGSDSIQTVTLKKEFTNICHKLNIKRLLDAPCGDCHWMKDIWDKLDLNTYVGLDIVEELILANREKYTADNRFFMWCDLVESKTLPTADLMICRDCLVHLSCNSAKQILKHMAESDISYFLITTFTNDDRNNHDWEDGTNWYPINLMKTPFNLPRPRILINEECTEANNEYRDKCLGLWTKEELIQACGI